MKLRNKKTGKVKDVWVQASYVNVSEGITVGAGNVLIANDIHHYDSLAELCKEWEDYEDPKEYYYISDNGYVCHRTEDAGESWDVFRKEIGNYFETKEEAEEAVEKLKAWKRLKDKGFRFDCWDNEDRATIHDFVIYCRIKDLDNINKDLDLLFSQEAK